jgi:hypothetical protein
MPKKRQRPTAVTALTLVVSGAWISAFVPRAFFGVPMSVAAPLDAAMLLVLGYWFSREAIKKKGDDDDDDDDDS